MGAGMKKQQQGGERGRDGKEERGRTRRSRGGEEEEVSSGKEGENSVGTEEGDGEEGGGIHSSRILEERSIVLSLIVNTSGGT